MLRCHLWNKEHYTNFSQDGTSECNHFAAATTRGSRFGPGAGLSLLMLIHMVYMRFSHTFSFIVTTRPQTI